MNSNSNNVIAQNVSIKDTETKSSKIKCCGIYGLRNKINGKWYVGFSQNIKRRWKIYEQHMCQRQPKIYNAIIKYGSDNFDKIILEECSIDQWEEKENFWINFYDSINKGYNCVNGGVGKIKEIRQLGKIKRRKRRSNDVCSIETHRRKSESTKRSWTKERREKQANRMRDKWKLGIFKVGVSYMKEETKRKLSQLRKIVETLHDKTGNTK